MARPDSYETPVGISIHPWINKPDTKFNTNGVFHTKVVFDKSLPEVATLIAKIEEKAQERYDFLTKDLTPAERKKWKRYAPVEDELDDQTGEPTGRVILTFKRNHKIKIAATGEEKELEVYVYDSLGNDIPGDDKPAIFGGTTMKVLFTFRDVKVPGTKNAGVKLDFFAVQIDQLSKGRGRSIGAINGDDPDSASTSGYVYRAGDKNSSAAKSSSQSEQRDDEGEDGDQY